MHDSVLAWVPTVVADDVSGARVLEVGSCDVNGSVRPAVEALGPVLYVGVDQSPGPRVDRVCDVAQLIDVFGADSFEVVISTEMLEHVVDWRAAVAGMAGVLAPGGLLVVTTRSRGFPYHPYPDDHWRFSLDGMRAVLIFAGLADFHVDDDPQAPGVFATARKPADWRGARLPEYVGGVTPMAKP